MAYNPYLPYYPPVYQQGINNDRLAYLQGYQQQMPQMPQPITQPQQQANQSLIWVQGEAGAKSYLVAPGANVLLMDSEAQRFYIKSVDASGVPTMRVYEYKELNAPMAVATEAKAEEYALKNEVDDLKREIERLKEKLEERHEPTIQPVKRKPKPAESYEYDE